MLQRIADMRTENMVEGIKSINYIEKKNSKYDAKLAYIEFKKSVIRHSRRWKGRFRTSGYRNGLTNRFINDTRRLTSLEHRFVAELIIKVLNKGRSI
jgi:hypothetical protein